MAEQPNVEIDLKELGKFQAKDKRVKYTQSDMKKPTSLQGKKSVKALMDDDPSGQRSGQLPSLKQTLLTTNCEVLGRSINIYSLVSTLLSRGITE